jgi:hypothetical protein
MQVAMTSTILVDIVSPNGFKYQMSIPFGSPYDDAFGALDAFKQAVEQMKNNAQQRAEPEPKKEE